MALWGPMGLCFDKMTIIHSWLCALDTLHSVAFNITAKYTLLQAAKYTLKYTSSLVKLCSQVSSQDTPKYTLCTLPTIPHGMLSSTPGHTLEDVPNCTWWHTHSLFDGTLPTRLSTHSQAHSWGCFPVHSQPQLTTHFQPAWLYTPS